MASTVKTRIIADLFNAIASIEKGTTYNRTVRVADRYTRNPDPTDFDAVYIERIREQKTQWSKVRHVDMAITLACFTRDGVDVAVAMDDLAADIEKAIRVDPYRGNLAIDTNVTGTDQIVIEDVEPIGAGYVEVEISFRHVLGDPCTAAG